MPINPMQFVTPIRQGRATSGIELGRFAADLRNEQARQKTSSGYLALQTRQQDFNEEKFGQAQLDKALAQLDDARLMGNADAVSAAEDNLRLIAQRNGYGISAAVSSGPAVEQATVSKDQLPATPGDTEAAQADEVLDADSPEFKAAADAELAAKAPTEAESNARIDAELGKTAPLGGDDPAKFEADLIAGSGQLPARMERLDTGTTPEMQALLARQFGQVPLPPNLQDFRSNAAPPKEAATAAPQAGGFAMPGRMIPPPRPLSSLTITDSKGREIYRATGDAKAVAERQRLRAASVFGELAKKAGDDVERQIIQQAGDVSAGLIGTMPLEKAVAVGLDMYQHAMQRKNAMSVVEMNRKPRYGGGGGGAGAGKFATGQQGTAQRAMTDDAWTAINNTMTNFDIKGLNKADNGLATAQSGLNSTNPASQRGAIRNILKAMSGLTVNAKEEAGYERLNGLADQARNMLAQLTGDEMSPDYIAAVKQMLAEWRTESARIRADAGRRAADAYVSFSPQAPDEVIQAQADGIFRYFVGGGTPAAGGERKYKSPEERQQPAAKKTADEEAADL